jgi:hypothetical protein
MMDKIYLPRKIAEFDEEVIDKFKFDILQCPAIEYFVQQKGVHNFIEITECLNLPCEKCVMNSVNQSKIFTHEVILYDPSMKVERGWEDDD